MSSSSEDQPSTSADSNTYSALRTLKLEQKLVGHFEESVPSSHPEMSEEEAIERLKVGQPVERVFIRRLHLQGEFTKPLLMREVYIKQLSWTQASFEQGVTLQACVVHRAYFEEVRCAQSVSLKRSRFRLLHMLRCEFKSGVNCESIKVGSKLVLADSRFEGRARFWDGVFDDWISIEGCHFGDRFDFRNTDCKAGLNLNKTHFEGPALFRGAHVALKLEANEARFMSLIDLSKAKLHDFVYLEDIEQGPEQRWAFWNTVSERILVRPDQVEGRLASEESGDHAQAMREYGVLKRSYEHEHLYSYDDWAFYRFKVNERLSRGSSWTRPWTKLFDLMDYLLLDWGCGYGTDPLRAVRAALVMVFFFAMIYTIGFDKVHPVEKLPFSELPADSLLNRFAVCLFLSVSAFTSGFGDLRESVMDWLNIPLVIEALLGTLLWGLFIVAFGRKVVR
jgi:hypothetical protein